MRIILHESAPQKLRLLIQDRHTVVNGMVSGLVWPEERRAAEEARFDQRAAYVCKLTPCVEAAGIKRLAGSEARLLCGGLAGKP